MNEPITIHTDGACSGNPGPGGFAAIIEVGEHQETRFTVTGGEPATTNNKMELSAVIEALRLINSQSDFAHSHVTIRSDSQYIVNAFNENWIESWQRKGWRTANKKPVANRDRWEALLKEIAPHPTRWVWVKGHNGDPMNEECDRLAVAQAAIAPDQHGYWTSAGNPLSEVASQRPSAPPLSMMELALERNEIAHRAIREAIALHNNGWELISPATGVLATALKHLEAQKDILEDTRDGDPCEAFPLTRAIVQDQNSKASQAVQRTNITLQEELDPAFTLQELTTAADILGSQHQALTNAVNESSNTTKAASSPETEQLLRQTAEDIENALDAMRQSQPWKTSTLLETALQKLANYRKAGAPSADAVSSPHF